KQGCIAPRDIADVPHSNSSGLARSTWPLGGRSRCHGFRMPADRVRSVVSNTHPEETRFKNEQNQRTRAQQRERPRSFHRRCSEEQADVRALIPDHRLQRAGPHREKQQEPGGQSVHDRGPANHLDADGEGREGDQVVIRVDSERENRLDGAPRLDRAIIDVARLNMDEGERIAVAVPAEDRKRGEADSDSPAGISARIKPRRDLRRSQARYRRQTVITTPADLETDARAPNAPASDKLSFRIASSAAARNATNVASG